MYTTGLSESETISPLLPWYAIRVRSNFEQAVAVSLGGKQYDSYLPLYRKPNSNSGKDVALPLFRGYVFCRIDLAHRLPVLITPGVVNIVAFGSTFVPIPENEIQAIKSVIRSGLPSTPWPFLRQGDRVRITSGAMEGVEGVLVQSKTNLRVVISVELLQRSVAVEIDRQYIQPLAGSMRQSAPTGV